MAREPQTDKLDLTRALAAPRSRKVAGDMPAKPSARSRLAARELGANGSDALQAQQRFHTALEAGVPQVYFNGFVAGLSTGDVYCVLERNGQPAGILNMSFTTAKSFAVSMGRVIAELEDKTNRDIMTTNDVEKVFADPNRGES